MFSTTTLRPLLRHTIPSQRPTACSTFRTIARFRVPASPSIHIPAPNRSVKNNSWDNIIGRVVQQEPTPVALSIDEMWLEKSRAVKLDLARQLPANPYSGRSVKVRTGNVADAYKRLEIILARNKVRAQLRLAERHEKKGAKRRRLSSERWRKQFAHEVRQKVQLVTQIRNRGA